MHETLTDYVSSQVYYVDEAEDERAIAAEALEAILAHLQAYSVIDGYDKEMIGVFCRRIIREDDC